MRNRHPDLPAKRMTLRTSLTGFLRHLVAIFAAVCMLTCGVSIVLAQDSEPLTSPPPQKHAPPIVVVLFPDFSNPSVDFLKNVADLKSRLRINDRLEVLSYDPEAPAFLVAAQDAKADVTKVDDPAVRAAMSRSLGARLAVTITGDPINTRRVDLSLVEILSKRDTRTVTPDEIDDRTVEQATGDITDSAIHAQADVIAGTQALPPASPIVPTPTTPAPLVASPTSVAPPPAPTPPQPPVVAPPAVSPSTALAPPASAAPPVIAPAPVVAPPVPKVQIAPAPSPAMPSQTPPAVVTPAEVPAQVAVAPPAQTQSVEQVPVRVSPPVIKSKPSPAPVPVIVTPPKPAPVIVAPTPQVLPSAPPAAEPTPAPMPVAPPAVIVRLPEPMNAAPIPAPEAPPIVAAPPAPTPRHSVSVNVAPDNETLTPPPTTPINDEAQKWISSGDQAMGSGDAGRAVDEYRHAVNESPRNAIPRLKLAQAYIAVAQQDMAVDELRRAGEIDPKSADLRDFLTDQAKRGTLPGADSLLLELKAGSTPNDPSSLIALGDSYWNSNHLDQAEQSYSQAAQLAPDLPDAYARLARLYAASERYDECLAALKKSGDEGYGSALRIIVQRSDSLIGDIDAALLSFRSGDRTRTELYGSLTNTDKRIAAYDEFIKQIQPPAAYKVSYLHRKLAANLLAQVTPALENYALTGENQFIEQGTDLEKSAEQELTLANVADKLQKQVLASGN